MIVLKLVDDNKLALIETVRSQVTTSIELQIEPEVDFDFRYGFSPSKFFKNNITQETRFHKGNSFALMLIYLKYASRVDAKREVIELNVNLFGSSFSRYLSSEVMSLPLDEIEDGVVKVNGLLNTYREIKDRSDIGAFSNVDELVSFDYLQMLLSSTRVAQEAKDTHLVHFLSAYLDAEREYRRNSGIKYRMEESSPEDSLTIQKALSRIDVRRRLVSATTRVHERVVNVSQKDEYIALSIATATIMGIVLGVFLQLRIWGLDTDYNYLVIFVALYVMRDLFRERLRRYIVHKLNSSRPRRVASLLKPGSKDVIGTVSQWIHTSIKPLSSMVYREDNVLRSFDYHGFRKLQKITTFDLSYFLRRIKFGRTEYYQFNDQQRAVKHRSAQRVRFNIILKEHKVSNTGEESNHYRYRLIAENSKLLILERIDDR
ncbi:hypothetical protein AB4254_13605 [Vibrio breoganii]